MRSPLYVVLTSYIFLLLSACAERRGVQTDQNHPYSNIGIKAASEYNAAVPHTYMDFMLNHLIEETPGFSPPAVSRSLGYIGVTLYESVLPGISNGHSMAGQLQNLTSLPQVDENEKYYWPLCANAGMYHIIKDIYSNATVENKRSLDSMYYSIKITYAFVDEEILERSDAFGKAIAKTIYKWSVSDGGHEAQLSPIDHSYIPPAFPGGWTPTLPVYGQALLPHWGNNRTFVAANAAITCPPPVNFSPEPSSVMYQSAKEVYNTSLSLTAEQETIALFWADGQGTLTPPGHSFSITKQILEAENASLAKSALTYAKLGISQADAFICCWKTKYTYNVVRPITYIQTYIDSAWLPLIATPPFPEYTSGHSTQSGAMLTILENIFGKNHPFTDHTWEATLGARSFKSFEDAANEAAVSRLYAGIHYRQSNQQGIFQGMIIGNNVNALKWTSSFNE